MGEEQGLSADSPALRLKRKAEWLRDQAYAIRAASDVWDFNEVQRLTSEADDIDAVLNAARSEGLQPPVGEVEEEVFSSLGASKAPSSASAGVAATPSGRETYRGWIIDYDPPPIPIRTCDWQFWHQEYDGPEDGRSGHAGSLDEARAEIDMREDD